MQTRQVFLHGWSLVVLALGTAIVTDCRAEEPRTMAEVLASSVADDWRRPDPSTLLYLELPAGLVIFELAPQFAPRHIENLRKLTRQQYFDGLAIVRSQDNYVVQWGDPSAGGEAAREFGAAASTLEPEFVVQRAGLALNVLNSRDAYSEEVGFVDGFPVGTDGDNAWLAHCYGMLGVGRGNDIASGSGAELYVVIGHAPRHLDRNVTLIGKAIYGLDHLSTLPRGSGALGFYETPVEMTTISSVRFGDSMAQAEQIEIELLRTDTDTFDQLIDARRNRREAWFHDSVGVIGLCNVPLPVRVLQ